MLSSKSASSGYSLLFLLFFSSAAPALRAQEDPHAGHEMPGMNHGSMDHSQMDHGQPEHMNEAGHVPHDMASGTSLNPLSWPMPMLMKPAGNWSFMGMGQAYLVDTQQSGPRGGDKLYSPNWFMGSASHALGAGSILFQAMLSLDPATVTNRRYPLLFQTGETAYGKPLTDAQHPHDLIMGLGIHYARRLAKETMLQLYYAPVGDPALGPVAFPHRASAMELPQATLGHHWQDSTHIAYNVATVALKHKWLRLEASGFHGTEPNENRWNIDWGPMNSYSGRISVFPGRNWMAQASAGKLVNPEPQENGDVVRTTASLHYIRPMTGKTSWATSFVWGRNHKQDGGHTLSGSRDTQSFLVETAYPWSRSNILTARVESVDKDELFASDHSLEHRLAETAGSKFRIGAYTVGYTRDFALARFLQSGIGANLTAYSVPGAIQPYYGEHPWGVNVYLRLRLQPGE